ncbi:uncharacterized protein N7511_004794 [Penicillium nucicola]|uniref:uncharacterized protein n=1 Tax=Penicillium nucicola TaxID=1850975 RepID=UPI00254573DF|nr:uncharacterized protein N7511_004794 [Penicillium nucicola]KAJ5767178.1 hypothetical protein N7511_004794 [Penicillium nucicola]
MVLFTLVLSVPIVTLWNTRISRRDKMVLFSIFSATLLVMIISILRVSVNTSLNTPVDPGWLIFWSFIEINTAIIISCAVSLRQIFVKSKQQSPRPSAGSSNLTPRKSYPKVHQRSIGDLESHDNEDILLSSMSDVHVRHEFEVVSTSAAESADDQTLSPQKKSFA